MSPAPLPSSSSAPSTSPSSAPVLALREATPEDEAFLRRLYTSTREKELAASGLDAAQREAFAAMQFAARRSGYRATFPEAVDRVVVADGEAAGRLLIDRSGNDLWIVDLALLPPWRGHGIGRRLLEDLLEEGRLHGRVVRLTVLRDNPAARLYASLGFRRISEAPPYWEMEWRAEETA